MLVGLGDPPISAITPIPAPPAIEVSPKADARRRTSAPITISQTVNIASQTASDRPEVAVSPGERASAGAGSVSTSTGQPSASDYQRQLLAYIRPFKRYPDDAMRSGVRGVVRLVFEIDRHGGLHGVWVTQSSGSQSLDLAAIDTVRRAAPLPPIPPALPDDVTIELPVAFTGPG